MIPENERILEQVVTSKAAGVILPELVETFNICIDHVLNKAQYKQYMPRHDDMKAAALLNLTKNWHHFNPELRNNPYAYFHSCIVGSFLDVLSREKREQRAKQNERIQN